MKFRHFWGEFAEKAIRIPPFGQICRKDHTKSGNIRAFAELGITVSAILAIQDLGKCIPFAEIAKEVSEVLDNLPNTSFEVLKNVFDGSQT